MQLSLKKDSVWKFIGKLQMIEKRRSAKGRKRSKVIEFFLTHLFTELHFEINVYWKDKQKEINRKYLSLFPLSSSPPFHSTKSQTDAIFSSFHHSELPLLRPIDLNLFIFFASFLKDCTFFKEQTALIFRHNHFFQRNFPSVKLFSVLVWIFSKRLLSLFVFSPPFSNDSIIAAPSLYLTAEFFKGPFALLHKNCTIFTHLPAVSPLDYTLFFMHFPLLSFFPLSARHFSTFLYIIIVLIKPFNDHCRHSTPAECSGILFSL